MGCCCLSRQSVMDASFPAALAGPPRPPFGALPFSHCFGRFFYLERCYRVFSFYLRRASAGLYWPRAKLACNHRAQKTHPHRALRWSICFHLPFRCLAFYSSSRIAPFFGYIRPTQHLLSRSETKKVVRLRFVTRSDHLDG